MRISINKLLVFLIIILIFICAILGDKVQKECEKTNGKWIIINNAGYNNTSYKCIK